MPGARLMAAASQNHYFPGTVRFDGTYDWLETGALTGIADGKVGTISFWLRMQGGDGTRQRILLNNVVGGSGNVGFVVQRTDTNKVQISGRYDDPGNQAIELTSGATCTVASGWVHILATWKVTTIDTDCQFYFNGISDIGIRVRNNYDIQYAVSDTRWRVGANFSGNEKLNADLADLWFDPTLHLDLGQESNLRKFRTASGRPAFLGANGSRPTGTPPILFLSGALSGWATNKGTGEGFSTAETLTAGSKL